MSAPYRPGGWLILYRLLLTFGMLLDTLGFTYSPNESASIGVIGGADGPTAIMVTGSVFQSVGFDWDIVFVAALLIVGVLGFLHLRRCRQE